MSLRRVETRPLYRRGYVRRVIRRAVMRSLAAVPALLLLAWGVAFVRTHEGLIEIAGTPIERTRERFVSPPVVERVELVRVAPVVSASPPEPSFHTTVTNRRGECGGLSPRSERFPQGLQVQMPGTVEASLVAETGELELVVAIETPRSLSRRDLEKNGVRAFLVNRSGRSFVVGTPEPGALTWTGRDGQDRTWCESAKACRIMCGSSSSSPLWGLRTLPPGAIQELTFGWFACPIPRDASGPCAVTLTYEAQTPTELPAPYLGGTTSRGGDWGPDPRHVGLFRRLTTARVVSAPML